MIRIDRDPDRRQLAIFAAVLPITFALLGAVAGYRLGYPVARNALWLLGAVLTLAYFALPRLRRPLYVGMSRAMYPIGWVLSHVILLIVFVFAVTPVALLLRALRHDPMRRRFDPAAPSYWVAHRAAGDHRRYFQQF